MERGLAGESGVRGWGESTVSNTERRENERRSKDEKQWEIIKDSWGARRREGEKMFQLHTFPCSEAQLAC